MTSRSTEPPRLSRRILRALIPAAERETVDGELLELFDERVERDGVRAARRWYRAQVFGFLLRAAPVRSSAPRRRFAASDRRVTAAGSARSDDEASSGGASLLHDVRWAVRSLRKHPGVTAVAVLVLALGIGANSAIFSLAGAHFLEPLPYDEPDDLVLIWETAPASSDVTTVSPGNYFAWRERTRSLADLAAFNVDQAVLSGEGEAERVPASVVTPHFFDLLGVSPLLGPGFDEATVRDADGRLVVLSHDLWARRYGSDPALVGRDIRIDGEPHTVVGVLPPDYRQPEQSLTWQAAELWRPLRLERQRDDFDSRFLRTIGRRSAGVSVEAVVAEMASIERELTAAHPSANTGWGVRVVTLSDYLLGESRPILLVLLGAGLAVFLVVCANVANLMLARGEQRRREFAVRAALGSGRLRLVRQLLVEGVLLGVLGGGAGLLLVLAGRGALQRVQERYFTGLVEVSVDLPLVLATTAAAVLAGVLFGLPAARAASSTKIHSTLSEAGRRGGAPGSASATRSLLIVGQVGTATALVAVALLLTRSLGSLLAVPPGFEPEGTMTFTLTAPSSRYTDRTEVETLLRSVGDELRAIPGVRQVGMVSDLPFTRENRWTNVRIDGAAPAGAGGPRVEYRTALPEYFDAMGIEVEEGAFPTDPWAETPVVPAAVNRRLATLFWPEEDPIGRTFDYGDDGVRVRVVSVVENVLDDGYTADADPLFYVPWGSVPRRRMSVVLDVDGDPGEVAAAVRSVVRGLDPEIPLDDLGMLETMMAETVARPRAASLIGSLVALLALLVATSGIYGVLSYLVHARTREIGIRAALGASGRRLVSMVLGQSLRLVLLGVLLGSGAALVAGHALSGFLFGISPWDPVSLGTAAIVLSGAGAAGAWLPARRAVRVDPREALSAE